MGKLKIFVEVLITILLQFIEEEMMNMNQHGLKQILGMEILLRTSTLMVTSLVPIVGIWTLQQIGIIGFK